MMMMMMILLWQQYIFKTGYRFETGLPAYRLTILVKTELWF